MGEPGEMGKCSQHYTIFRNRKSPQRRDPLQEGAGTRSTRYRKWEVQRAHNKKRSIFVLNHFTGLRCSIIVLSGSKVYCNSLIPIVLIQDQCPFGEISHW